MLVIFFSKFSNYGFITLAEKLGPREKRTRKINPQNGTGRCWLRLCNLSLHPITNITREETRGPFIQTCNMPSEADHYLITKLCSMLRVVFFFSFLFVKPFSKMSYMIVLCKFNTWYGSNHPKNRRQHENLVKHFRTGGSFQDIKHYRWLAPVKICSSLWSDLRRTS